MYMYMYIVVFILWHFAEEHMYNVHVHVYCGILQRNTCTCTVYCGILQRYCSVCRAKFVEMFVSVLQDLLE